jgi:hypothetical protein
VRLAMELPQPGVARETSPHDFACSRNVLGDLRSD